MMGRYKKNNKFSLEFNKKDGQVEMYDTSEIEYYTLNTFPPGQH